MPEPRQIFACARCERVGNQGFVPGEEGFVCKNEEACQKRVQKSQRMAANPKVDWDAVVLHAAGIVQSYDTGVTLRQLFYRLVSAQLIPNSQNAYARLSRTTAVARREGWFPDLIDNTRGIMVPSSWEGPAAAIESMRRQYRRDRTIGQEFTVYVAVEKNALRTQLQHWFSERGIPVLAFGGYPSQTFVKQIMEDIDAQERPAILIYGGDFDATGVDILRDFQKRTEGYWEDVQRIALNPDQIEEYKLPPLPGKDWDPRAANFEAMYGELIQVELDALPPNVLKQIYEDAVGQYWDTETYEKVVEQEEEERDQILLPKDIKNVLMGLRKASVNIHMATKLRGKPNKKRVAEWKDRIKEFEDILEKYEEAFDV